MKHFHWLCCAAGAVLMSQSANALDSNLSLNYLKQDLEVTLPTLGSGSDDGDGFGISGVYAFNKIGHISAAYQQVDIENLESSEFRIGGGAGYQVNSVFFPYGRTEFARIDLENQLTNNTADDSGVIFSAGVVLSLTERFQLDGRVGLVALDDTDGGEIELGATARVTDNFGVFASYRGLYLEDDFNNEIDFDDVRAGVRFLF